MLNSNSKSQVTRFKFQAADERGVMLFGLDPKVVEDVERGVDGLELR